MARRPRSLSVSYSTVATAVVPRARVDHWTVSVGPARASAGAAGLVLLSAGSSAGTGLLSRRLLASMPASLDAATLTPVDHWVELFVTAVGAVAAAWLALSGLLAVAWVVAARLGLTWRAGERALRRTAPRAVHKLARLAVGVGVGTGLALVPATAHAADAHEPATPNPSAVVTSLDLGWQPTNVDKTAADQTSADRDDPNAPVASRPVSDSPVVPPHGAAEHVVVRGDTLWAIASASLGEAPGDADVARAVARWHETNRDVIGDDPDVILPGQVLHAPA